ncbi:hypothetical protein EW145_g44 [Phellinidium pouzarii]|uniref:Uncharacterized protein n=1 Tax=Phellinidium pouzarii TaxID=167371 RepID=A0A4S4LKJ3_9AGAM|nr:hypothetical protein EW145_g44 [Phellinidium pouzarii]
MVLGLPPIKPELMEHGVRPFSNASKIENIIAGFNSLSTTTVKAAEPRNATLASTKDAKVAEKKRKNARGDRSGSAKRTRDELDEEEEAKMALDPDADEMSYVDSFGFGTISDADREALRAKWETTYEQGLLMMSEDDEDSDDEELDWVYERERLIPVPRPFEGGAEVLLERLDTVSVDIGRVLEEARRSLQLRKPGSFSDAFSLEVHNYAIKAGRYPILENAQVAGTLVANDVYCCDTSSFQIIQGPNMSGAYLLTDPHTFHTRTGSRHPDIRHRAREARMGAHTGAAHRDPVR